MPRTMRPRLAPEDDWDGYLLTVYRPTVEALARGDCPAELRTWAESVLVPVMELELSAEDAAYLATMRAKREAEFERLRQENAALRAKAR